MLVVSDSQSRLRTRQASRRRPPRGRRHRLPAILLLAVVLAPLAVASASAGSQVSAPSNSKTIEVQLHQYGFDPGIIRVNQGDEVTLILNATDVAHGFFVDGYGIDVPVVPGKPVSITFTADKAGHFNIRCSLNCGTFHPYMLGRLEVSPNSALVVALLSAVGLTALSLAFAWKAPTPEAAGET